MELSTTWLVQCGPQLYTLIRKTEVSVCCRTDQSRKSSHLQTKKTSCIVCWVQTIWRKLKNLQFLSSHNKVRLVALSLECSMHCIIYPLERKERKYLLFKQTLRSCFTQSGAYESCLACHTLFPIIVSGLLCNWWHVSVTSILQSTFYRSEHSKLKNVPLERLLKWSQCPNFLWKLKWYQVWKMAPIYPGTGDLLLDQN